MGDQSIDIYCGIILVALFPMSVLIVLYYAEPGFPWHSYITLVMGYYAAFGIMLMVPIDIGTVVIDRRSTTTGSDSAYNYDKESLTTIYNVFFTMVLVLGSAVLGFQEYYNTDGKSLLHRSAASGGTSHPQLRWSRILHAGRPAVQRLQAHDVRHLRAAHRRPHHLGHPHRPEGRPRQRRGAEARGRHRDEHHVRVGPHVPAGLLAGGVPAVAVVHERHPRLPRAHADEGRVRVQGHQRAPAVRVARRRGRVEDEGGAGELRRPVAHRGDGHPRLRYVAPHRLARL